MAIKDRMTKVNEVAAASTTQEIYRRDHTHRVFSVVSQRTGKPYQVTLDFGKTNGQLEITAHLFTFDHKEMVAGKKHGWHPANDSAHTVNYMALGVIKAAVKAQGKVVAFADTKMNAFLSSIFWNDCNPQLIKVWNASGNGHCWAVVADAPKDQPDPKSQLAANVALMRGDSGMDEDYIG